MQHTSLTNTSGEHSLINNQWAPILGWSKFKRDLKIDPSKILDIVDKGKIYLVYTIDGIEKLEKSKDADKLYWAIKLRNRRKAFGL